MIFFIRLFLVLFLYRASAQEDTIASLTWESLDPQKYAYVSRPFSSFLGEIYNEPNLHHRAVITFDSLDCIEKKHRTLVALMLQYKAMRQLNALRDSTRGAKIVKNKAYYYVVGEWRHPKESEEEDNPDDMDDTESAVEYISERELLREIFLDRSFYKKLFAKSLFWDWRPEIASLSQESK